MANLFTDQKIIIGTGVDGETAIIKSIGTAGGTTLGAETGAGVTVIPVKDVEGFNTGQTIIIDNGSNRETVVIASIKAIRRRFGSNNNQVDSITVTKPLTKAHKQGVNVSGSGITFKTNLTKTHKNGTLVTGYIPTPGKPNKYSKKL